MADKKYNWRELQRENQANQQHRLLPEDLGLPTLKPSYAPFSSYAYSGPERSPLMQNTTRTGSPDFWGNSIFDDDTATIDEFNALGDVRAMNEPGILKIANGVTKGFITAGTTALEGIGILFGAGQGLVRAARADDGEGFKKFKQSLWDNPLTGLLQKFQDYSEEYLPNYYTEDEQKNPFSHLFNANFIGDKLIKNFGFMVGAFYGGLPVSGAIGKVGQNAVKMAEKYNMAARIGRARRAADIARRAEEAGEDVATALSKAKLTQAERTALYNQGLDNVQRIAGATKHATMMGGSLFSAFNEGAIEAINGARDWEQEETARENGRFQSVLSSIQSLNVSDEKKEELAQKAYADHDRYLEEIQEGKARVGNAILCGNVPVLMLSNMAQLGRLYTRGFTSSARMYGNLWNGHKLSEKLADSSIKSGMTWKKGIFKAALNANYEGVEEYLQRAISDGAGKAVQASIDRYVNSGGDTEASESMVDFVKQMGKAVITNFKDDSAREEYLIGALSAMLGMPTYGSQTKNAYMKLGKVGFSGGFFGEYKDYKEKMNREKKAAEFMNEYVKKSDMKTAFDTLIKYDLTDKFMRGALTDEDKALFKDLDFEKLFHMINLASSTGHLGELKAMVEYDKDYTDEDLDDIFKTTTVAVSAKEQKEKDEQDLDSINHVITTLEKKEREGKITKGEKITLEAYKEDGKKLEEKINKDEYKDKVEGPFAEYDGKTVKMIDRDKVVEVLERNKQHLLDSINNYEKIRNRIEIETDGMLDDNQLTLQTMIRMKIYDIDSRAAEMALDVIDKLGLKRVRNSLLLGSSTAELYKEELNIGNDNIKKLEGEYKAAKTARKEAEDNKLSEKEINDLKEKEEEAKKKLENTKSGVNWLSGFINMLNDMTEKKKPSWIQRLGYKQGIKLSKDGEGKVYRESLEKYAPSADDDAYISSDEILKFFAPFDNYKALYNLVGVGFTSGLSFREREEFIEDIVDLARLSLLKVEYNKALMKYLKPENINKAFEESKQRQEKIINDDIINKLVSRLQEATTFVSLDKIYDDINNGSGMASKMLEKAIETADEEVKKFLQEYKKARDLLIDLYDKALSLVTDEEVRKTVVQSLNNAWDTAISNSNNSTLVETFQNAINNELSKLEKTLETYKNDKVLKKAIAAIKDILKSLNFTQTSQQTNAKVTTNSAPAPVKNGAKMERKEVIDKILQYFRSLKKDNVIITSLEEFKAEFGEEAWKMIDDFNKSESNEKLRISNEVIATLFQAHVVNAKRIKSVEVDDENGNDVDFEQFETASEMSNVVKSSFITSPTKYETHDAEISGRRRYNKKEKEYSNPITELVKKTVDEAGGYDFLDKNYLAIITNTITHTPKFHMAVSRDKNNRDVVYIALQMTDEYCKILEDNLGEDVTEEIKRKFVTINGLNYQLLPPIYVANNAAPEVRRAFENLVGKREVVDDKEVRTKGIVLRDVEEYLKNETETHGYVLYDSLKGKSDCTLTLADEYDNKYGQLTGRLERDGSDAEGNPITSTKYTSLKVFLSESEEWGNRKDKKSEVAKAMKIGVLVGSGGIDVEFSRADHFAQKTADINRITREKKQGSVYIMVLRPDGRYYPLMCKRKSIKKWLESKESHDMLEKVISGEHKNEYLEEVVGLVKTMLDSKKEIGQRIHAKTRLSEYINIRKENDTDPYPINIDAFNEGVKLIVEGKEYLYKINDKNPTLEDLTMSFIKGLAEKLESRAIFTIPMGSSKITEDIVDADVLEINLNGFYNFNSSLNFIPIDENGKKIDTSNPTGGPTAGSGYVEVISLGNAEGYTIDVHGVVRNPEGEIETDIIKKIMVMLNSNMIPTIPVQEHLLKGDNITLDDERMQKLNAELAKPDPQYGDLSDFRYLIVDDKLYVVGEFNGKNVVFNDVAEGNKVVDKIKDRVKEFLRKEREALKKKNPPVETEKVTPENIHEHVQITLNNTRGGHHPVLTPAEWTSGKVVDLRTSEGWGKREGITYYAKGIDRGARMMWFKEAPSEAVQKQIELYMENKTKDEDFDDTETLARILNGEKVFEEKKGPEEAGTQGGEGTFNEGTDSERWYIREELDGLDKDTVEDITTKTLAEAYESVSDVSRAKAVHVHKYLHEKGVPIRISSFDVFSKLVDIGLDDDDVSVDDFKTAFNNYISSIENDTHCRS